MVLNSRKGLTLYVLPLVLYCVGIFTLSSFPLPEMPSFGFDFQDKLNHLVAYFLMTILAYRAITWLRRKSQLKRGELVLFAFLFVALYGATDEIHQMFVPGRTADIFDWIADCAGAVLAIPLLMKLPVKLLGYRPADYPRTAD
ncbi:MAG: VanZ family protein [Ignavibacteriae bacterium]|nr:VanZ family protein [Ignavibacteriota bacterium]MCB9216968.1 VanZ family protein [Ignavibacteria bacterium]